jgi:hypothetical protein
MTSLPRALTLLLLQILLTTSAQAALTANTASVKSSNESFGMSAGATVTFGSQVRVSFQLG